MTAITMAHRIAGEQQIAQHRGTPAPEERESPAAGDSRSPVSGAPRSDPSIRAIRGQAARPLAERLVHAKQCSRASDEDAGKARRGSAPDRICHANSPRSAGLTASNVDRVVEQEDGSISSIGTTRPAMQAVNRASAAPAVGFQIEGERDVGQQCQPTRQNRRDPRPPPAGRQTGRRRRDQHDVATDGPCAKLLLHAEYHQRCRDAPHPNRVPLMICDANPFIAVPQRVPLR